MNVVTAFAPGSIGNIGPGLDILGCAVSGPGDEVEAHLTHEPGIIVRDAGHPDLPTDPTTNSAAIAAAEVLRRANVSRVGISLGVRKGLPLAGGQGGSAASAVAGAVAANALLDEPLDRQGVLAAALEAEARVAGRHGDNVAAALYGGVILVHSLDPLEIVQIPFPEALRVVLVLPQQRMRTAEARSVLPNTLDRALALRQAAHVAAMITAFTTPDLQLLRTALRDEIAEPVRAPLLKGFSQARDAALAAGALGCSISGAGPTSFALAADDTVAADVMTAMVDAYRASGVEASGRVECIDERGARYTLDHVPEKTA